MKKRGIFLASLRHDIRVAFSNPWLKRRAYIFSLLQTHDRHSVFWSLFARRFFFVDVIFTLVHIFLSFSFLLLLRSISTVSIILAFLSYFSTFSNLPSISLSDGIDRAMCAHIFLSSSLIKKKKKNETRWKRPCIIWAPLSSRCYQSAGSCKARFAEVVILPATLQ